MPGDGTPAALARALADGFSGPIHLEAPEPLRTDFGRLRRATPMIVATPRREEDVAHALRVARRFGVPVTIRGAGHSCHGQSLSDGGILLTALADEPEAALLDDGVVSVSGRASWRGLERWLNAAGRRAPVITDNLDLTVGGTLSVGGLGLTSIRDGLQVDRVRRLRLIRPDGEGVWCDRDAHPELFRFALGGLGQVGVIERVEMETRPYRTYTHAYERRHADLRELVDFARAAAAPGTGVDHYNGYVRHGACSSEYGYLTDDDARDDGRLGPGWARPGEAWSCWRDHPFALHDRRVAWFSAFTEHVRLWTGYFVPGGAADGFADALTALLADDAGRSVQAVHVFAVRRDPPRTPFAFAPTPPGGLLIGFGVYAMAHRFQPVAIGRATRQLDAALAACAELGGRPYLYGYHRLTEALKRRFYGHDLDRLRELGQGGPLDPRGFPSEGS